MNEDELAERLEREMPSSASPAARGETAARLRGLLSDETTWLETPPGGADALVAAIRAESQPSEPPSTSVAAYRGPRRYLTLSLAAVLLLLAGIAGGMLLAGSGDDDGTEREPSLELALTGTDLAPNASAAVAVHEWRSGFAIRLDIAGLPPADPGTYYEGWITGPDGRVSIGTFHMLGGDGPVELWSGVELERYPTLTVTIQEEGAGPESSGRVVLSGVVGSGSGD